jgi:hypothetical protein
MSDVSGGFVQGPLLAAAGSLAAIISLASTGCLEPYCARDADCRSLERCNLSTHRCERADAGPAWPVAPACEPACENPTPICDATALACRACEADAECEAAAPDLPACHQGRCVACTDSRRHCGGDTPICNPATQRCEACTGDPQCADLDSAAPACVAGACRPCGDSAAHCDDVGRAVCDEQSHECRACREHVECAHFGGVCDGGVCLRETAVTYVSQAASVCPGDGSRDAPHCQIQQALDSPDLTGTVLVAPGSYAPIQVEDLEVWIIGQEPGAQIRGSAALSDINAVTVLHPSGAVQAVVTLERLTLAEAQGTATAAGLQCGSLGGTPQVTLVDVEVTDNQTGGLQISDCALTVHGGRIHGNAGLGISASDSDLRIDRLWVEDNADGGILVERSSFVIENTIIARNGGTNAITGGVGLSAPALPAALRHVTVVDNALADVLTYAGGIGCVSGDCAAVQLRSSIVAGHGADGDLSPAITPGYSLIQDGSGGTGGPGNRSGDPGFSSATDAHITPASPCAGGGDPASPVDRDIDGQSRPRPAGTPPDCGADEVAQ